MKEQVEEKNTEMGSIITRSEEFIENNQKKIWICLIVIVLAVIAIFGVKNWYLQPREEAAYNEMFAAEQWFAAQDFQKALEGDDQFSGFNAIIDEYGSTKAGNLARYYAGVANLRLGNYEEAIDLLKKYKGKDDFSRPMSLMLQGDAYMEMGNTADAIAAYKKAADADDNLITTPTALFKEGIALLMEGDSDAALQCFKKVKKNYPRSTEYNEIDKYIAIALGDKTEME